MLPVEYVRQFNLHVTAVYQYMICYTCALLPLRHGDLAKKMWIPRVDDLTSIMLGRVWLE